jgi:hypothetical protein
VTIRDYLEVTVWAMLAAELACSFFVLRWWGSLTRTGRLVGGWLLAATLFNAVGKIARFTIQNSLIVTFFWFPASSILAFNALASMHPPGRSRIALRAVSWMMVIGWAVLALTVEVPGEYSRFMSPAHAMLLAAAAAYTLITRVEASRVDLLQDSSFVIAAFWVVYAVPTVFLTVAARLWIGVADSGRLTGYYSFRNSIVVLAYAALLYGVYLSNTRRRHPLPATAGAGP